MGDPAEISVRDLRNHVSEVLRRVEAGEHLRITVDRRPVAQIVPLPRKRPSLPMNEFLAWRARSPLADPALGEELREAAGDSSDDVDVR
jgi:prevent-host-death family protein